MNRLIVSFVGLLACLAACQAMPEQEFPFGRIVNGEPTTIEAHPYQVSIQTTKGAHFCGGSLIDSQTVVTAAHCMQSYKANEMQVRLGSTDRNKGGEVVSVAAFKFHEGYNSKLMINDVAVIRLSSPVRQSANVRFVSLAKTTPPSGTPAVVTGWGTTCFLFCSSTITLQQVEVDLVSLADCGSSTYSYGQDKILETMVCAYTETKDACQGDSGGPLVANGELVGIVSWGQGCAKANYPGVYADVASLRTWIESTAANL
ncbi:trypsin [Drosophila hydei]|uniref:Trypsin n=1 Tax=Drosophila hydei TaxID=7224 RepID=A0A6J1LB88_DROHY|nr:trypsin [Drosophila hydei]